MLSQILKLWNRKKRAARYGLRFERSSKWQLPSSVRVNGLTKPFHLPQDHGTKIAFLDIFLDDCYRIESLKKKKIEPRKVVDIGGHAGLFSSYFKSHYPCNTVHCYEPNPALQPFLLKQAETWGFEVFNEAVGSRDGFVNLNLSIGDSVHTQAVTDAGGSIKLTAFGRCIERIGGEIDLLKMDCEGGEWDIFTDTESWKKVRSLAMEYHLTEGRTLETLDRALKNIRFQTELIVPLGPAFGLAFAHNLDFR